MSYYLVMNAYNHVIGRFENEKEATACARHNGGFIVPFRKGRNK